MTTSKHYFGFLSLGDTCCYVTEDVTIKPEWLGSSLKRRLDCRRYSSNMLHLVSLVALLFQGKLIFLLIYFCNINDDYLLVSTSMISDCLSKLCNHRTGVVL